MNPMEMMLFFNKLGLKMKLDTGMTILLKRPIASIHYLDKQLCKKYGDYLDKNKTMSEFLEEQYGKITTDKIRYYTGANESELSGKKLKDYASKFETIIESVSELAENLVS